MTTSGEQIQKAADIYHTWQAEGTDGANYAVPELYRGVSKDEIEKQGWSLVCPRGAVFYLQRMPRV